ncbi:MAG: hypothetical protein ACR2N5_06010 [Solirubrobacterales bacterium]
MSGDAGELRGLAARLSELAQRLSSEGTAEEEAVALAREAAELSARAGQAIDSALAELGEAREPGLGTHAEDDPA